MGKKKKSKHQQKVEETTSNNKPGHDASAELQSKNEADNVSEGHKLQNLDPQSTTNLTDDDKVLKKVQLDEIKPKPVLSDKNGVEVHSVLSSLNPDAKPFQIGKKGPKQATKLEEASKSDNKISNKQGHENKNVGDPYKKERDFKNSKGKSSSNDLNWRSRGDSKGNENTKYSKGRHQEQDNGTSCGDSAWDNFQNDKHKTKENKDKRYMEKNYKENKPKKANEGDNWRDHNKNTEKHIKKQDNCDKEFGFWEKNIKEIGKEFKVVEEMEGDLFQQPPDYSLAHCVAADLRMGSGIAVNFKQQFKNLDNLLDQRAKQGGLAILHDEENNRYIYYLVTKRESNLKPTNNTLWRSLWKMREHIVDNKVKNLAVPRLGCGLDRLEWDEVKTMLEYLFKDANLHIRVCNFQQTTEEQPKKYTTCRQVKEAYPITKIESGTAIFYFTTENGDEDATMKALDKKYNFLGNFRRERPKIIGNIVKFESKNDYLFGCVVRKTVREPLNFHALNKCILSFNKLNRSYKKDAFSYVAFQNIDEDSYQDSLINEKIVTLLTNQLRDVNVYICTGLLNE